MEVLKIAIMAICGVFMILILKNVQSQTGVVVALGVSVIIMLCIITRLMQIIRQIQYINSYISIGSDYIEILVKIIGITYITEFASDICKDNGQQAISGQIEVFGKLTIAAISMPVVLALFETVIKCTG